MGASLTTITEKLTHALPTLPRKLAVAARYALDNPERIALESMRASAQACGVSGPTLLRLARHMGFAGYDEFRKDFQHIVIEQSFAPRVQALRSGFRNAPQGNLARDLAEAASRNIAETAAQLDPAAITAFVSSTARGGRTFVIGAGSMYWLAGLMEATGRIALSDLVSLAGGNVSATERILTIRPRDTLLALGVAPYAVQTVDAMHYARRAGADVFAITDRPSSPLALFAKAVFVTPTDSPHYYPSTIAVQLVVETLLAACVAASGDSTRQRLKQIDEIRRASGSYMD
ncbi:MurR/RpiR family transcriptional regulator [Pelagivirga sediminicola]|nr:MurR/RpiR family transcriptional regulator [Pelagivirga sediminicola]